MTKTIAKSVMDPAKTGDFADSLPMIPEGYRWNIRKTEYGEYIVALNKKEVVWKRSKFFKKKALTEEWTTVSSRSAYMSDSFLKEDTVKLAERCLADIESCQRLAMLEEEVLGIYEPKRDR